MELGEIIEKSFKLWFHNLKVGFLFFAGYLSILVVMLIPFAVIWKVTNGNLLLAKEVLYNYPYVIVIFFGCLFISLFISLFFYFSGIRACVLTIDENLSLREAMKYALRKYLSFLGAEILKYLILAVPTLIFLLFAFLFTAVSFSPSHTHPTLSDLNLPLMLLLFLIFSIVYLILLIFLVYIPYAVADGFGAIDSLKVSFKVTKNCFLNTIIILILIFAISFLCSMVARLLTLPFIPLYFELSNLSSNIVVFSKVLAVYLLAMSLLESFVLSPLRTLLLILNMRNCL